MSDRRMTFLRKGLLIILLPVVAQVVLLIVLLRQQQRHNDAQALAIHTKEVLQQLDGLIETVLLRQNQLRGLLLGLPQSAESPAAQAKEVEGQLATLARQVADNPDQVKRLRQLRETVTARLEWEAPLLAAIASGNRDEAMAGFASGGGVRLMDSIRTQASAMRQAEERLDHTRIRALREATRMQNRMVFAGLAVTVLAAGAAMWLFSQGIVRRVLTLAANVERVKRGEPLAPVVWANDELGDLDGSFHTMAEALADSRKRDYFAQQIIERRNEELTRANHELAQKNQENEMFVYSVSHDLRSPLVNLQGFSRELGMIRDDLRGIFTGELPASERARGRQLVEHDVSECIHYIQTAVMRLSTIIDALLRLSRAGRVEYQPRRVELAPVAERVVGAMRDSIAARKCTVQVHPLPQVWGDAAALEQILANLVGNAVNYLDPGRPGEVEVGVAPPGASDAGLQVIYVRDNGLGIAAAYQPKVFTAFRRMHERMAPGEGIGLALVRRAVERHGGRIWLESQEGVGSTFFVGLPPEENSPLKVVPKKESLSVHISQPKADPAPKALHAS